MISDLSFVTGAIVGMVVVLILGIRKRKRIACQYDERQKQNLNLGYRYGFNGMVIFMAVFSLVCQLYAVKYDVELVSLAKFVFISILVGIAIVSVFTIFTDSYLQSKTNMKKFYFTNISIGLMNLILAITLKSFINFIAALLMFIIAGGVYIRNRFHKEDEE